MERIGIITGLRSEVRCLKNTPVYANADIRISGANSAVAFEQARELAAQGCGALVSFGIAGGLDPRIRAGSLILANEVITKEGERFRVDENARKALHKLVGLRIHISHSPMLGTNRLILSSRRKVNLFVDTGAAAVDMESLAVARAATDAGIPFLVVRTISDTAYQRLPLSVHGVIAPDGRSRPMKAVRNLLNRPHDLSAMLRLLRGSKAAHKCLRRVAMSGGPWLGFG